MVLLPSDIRSVEQLKQLPPDAFYVTVNGKIVDVEQLQPNSIFQVHFRLRGGKGGFGSLLRSFRIRRSTNQLMCRDLSGRRLADVKEEERLRNWIKRAGVREAERRRKLGAKYEKLKAGPPKHIFHDPAYIRTREKLLEDADDAFDAGLAYMSSMKNNKIAAHKRIRYGTDVTGCSVDVLVADLEKKHRSEMGGSKEVKFDDRTSGNGFPSQKAQTTEKCAEVVDKNDLSSEPAVNEAKKEQMVKELDTKNYDPINLDEFPCAESLHSLGLAHLKHELEARGLKCGGTLAERASRLYSVKGLNAAQYPRALKVVIRNR